MRHVDPGFEFIVNSSCALLFSFSFSFSFSFEYDLLGFTGARWNVTEPTNMIGLDIKAMRNEMPLALYAGSCG